MTTTVQISPAQNEPGESRDLVNVAAPEPPPWSLSHGGGDGLRGGRS
jgi:hypothetical protein